MGLGRAWVGLSRGSWSVWRLFRGLGEVVVGPGWIEWGQGWALGG